MSNSRKNLLRSARAQRADEDWDAMRRTMRDVGRLFEEDGDRVLKVTKEGLALFSISYKHAAERRRRDISYMDRQTDLLKEKHKKEKRQELVGELEEICFEIIDLIDEQLLPRVDHDDQLAVFYMKEKGDFYRYLAEAAGTHNKSSRKDLADSSEKSYAKAMELARAKLQPTDHMRLATAVNYGVLLHDVNHSPEDACRIADRALEESRELYLKSLDPAVPERQFQLSYRARYLLEENSAHWSAKSTF